MAKKSDFGNAFAAARKQGLKEFTFGGKKYTTKTKEETIPVPTPRPTPPSETKASVKTERVGYSAKADLAAKLSANPSEKTSRVPAPAKSALAGKMKLAADLARTNATKEKPKVGKDFDFFRHTQKDN